MGQVLAHVRLSNGNCYNFLWDYPTLALGIQTEKTERPVLAASRAQESMQEQKPLN